jgi:hypothetical protein
MKQEVEKYDKMIAQKKEDLMMVNESLNKAQTPRMVS